mgnify:CR=1 FL=1
MRRFQFRLEQILKIRRYKEREWEMKLARITGICLDLENRIEFKREEIKRSFTIKGRGVDVHRLAAGELYRTRLLREIERLTLELEEREREREKVKESYLVASRERKVLDKLSERKEKEYYTHQFREEIKVLDDLAGGVAARKSLIAEDSF